MGERKMTRAFFLFVTWVFLIFLLFSIMVVPVAAVEFYFTILHTNDEHSALIPHSAAVDYALALEGNVHANPAVGGFARLAGAVKQLREEKTGQGEEVLLISAGDFLGGTPYSWLALSGQAPELLLMRRIGYDLVTLGNHEFDYGPEVLAGYLQAAGYPEAAAGMPVVATNTMPPADHPLAAVGLTRTHLVELANGLRVGFFGLLGKAAVDVVARPGPVRFSDQHQAAREAVGALKARGAQVIIAVTHAGIEEDRELAQQVEGIDLIISGHCHTALTEPLREGRTIIAQTGNSLQYLGLLELAYTPGSGLQLRNGANRPYLLPLDDRITPDPEIAAAVAEYTGACGKLLAAATGGRFPDLLAVIARSDFTLPNPKSNQETPAGNFVADAMRLVTAEKTGEKVDFAFQAAGQIRQALTPGRAEHARGLLSLYDLLVLCPLGMGPDGNAGYPVVSFYLTGEEVRRVLEITALLPVVFDHDYFVHVSGLRYDYSPQRILWLTVPGKNLPVPSMQAVFKAERYAGEGIQPANGGEYLPLLRGDDTLYRVVSDYYMLQFLPMVGNLLPRLAVVPKDKTGAPLSLDAAVVRVDGAELKIWQTLVEYTAGQQPGEDGIPVIDRAYAGTAGRINAVKTLPLLVWALVGLLFLSLLLAFLVISPRAYRWRRKQRSRPTL
jgi:2',3'-cyclic-nucleotide 2'-phosphodiesterase (5'-nucleotidase family)